LRETTNVPILFISARTSDDDVLLALNVGGDDYIQKPYSLAILLAKVKAVLKRYKTTEPEPNAFVSGNLKIDFTAESVFVAGKSVELKAMEYKLLTYLVKNKGCTVTKDELFREVWADSITGDNTLNVHIRHLREKIEADPNKPMYIKTVWGVGYVFMER
jgi:two-component system response regulator RegX3